MKPTFLSLSLGAVLLSIASLAVAGDGDDADDVSAWLDEDLVPPPPVAAGGDCAAMATHFGKILGGPADDPELRSGLDELAQACRDEAWPQPFVDCVLTSTTFDGMDQCLTSMIDAELAELEADSDASIEEELEELDDLTEEELERLLEEAEALDDEELPLDDEEDLDDPSGLDLEDDLDP